MGGSVRGRTTLPVSHSAGRSVSTYRRRRATVVRDAVECFYCLYTYLLTVTRDSFYTRGEENALYGWFLRKPQLVGRVPRSCGPRSVAGAAQIRVVLGMPHFPQVTSSTNRDIRAGRVPGPFGRWHPPRPGPCHVRGRHPAVCIPQCPPTVP